MPDSDGGYSEEQVAELTNEEIKELRPEWTAQSSEEGGGKIMSYYC